MKLKFMVLQIITILSMGCSFFRDETEWIRKSASVVSVAIPDSVSISQPVIFKMTCLLYSLCWELSHLEMSHFNFDVWVKVYAKKNPKFYCNPVLLSSDTTGNFISGSLIPQVQIRLLLLNKEISLALTCFVVRCPQFRYVPPARG